MDVLSHALDAVHMSSAIFYYAECTAPWGFAVPSLQQVAHMLAPGVERLVPYHLVTEGRAHVAFEDGSELEIEAGDVVIIPLGDAHTVSNGRPTELVDSGKSLGKFLCGDLRTMRMGGGGERTGFICGYFGCERGADRLFLAGLPRIIKINARADATGKWLEDSIRYLVGQADRSRPGQSILLSRMAEALFVETLRRYMERMPSERIGWLAGARDPIVGGALALLHQQPSVCWTVDELATKVGASRSVLTERFARFLGEPPLTYLAGWRLHLAARLLVQGGKPIAQIAFDVGYESQAAFNRAFKREFGTAPGQYRKERRWPLPAGER